MSDRATLLAALQQARGLVAALETALAEHDAAPESAPVPARRLIDSAVAKKVSGMSSTWLYENARLYGFGFQRESGSWRFDRDLLIAFVNGRKARRAESDASVNSVNDDGSNSEP
ncbi:hypothetical protein AMST5_01866 [freshwater sediment metagenome]|uniref:Uncharacterized protein n=1 Tax=freshwater sediment metagenome TaxID=556182 RepID=A0AA48LZ14_9ZZZZ